MRGGESGKPGDFNWRPQRLAGLLRTAKAIGLIVFRAAIVVIRAHRAVAAVVLSFGCVWPIYRQLHMICAEPVTMGIAVGEQAALQHLVGGGTDARHEMCRID